MTLASPGVRYTMQQRNPAMLNQYPVRNAMVIYYGALVGLSTVGITDGRAVNWSVASGALRFLGIAIVKGDRDNPFSVTGNSGGTNVVQVYEGGGTLEGITVTGASSQQTVGDPVFASDENTFTLTQTSNVGAVGRVSRYRSGSVVDVQLFSSMEYMALESIGKV